jgi:hypothetical protein
VVELLELVMILVQMLMVYGRRDLKKNILVKLKKLKKVIIIVKDELNI